ncbi:hypothetical protein P153DRAFT_112960 [Dothidotthia symphoricarpi CBS 119687]|uniref:SRCR domain-containing protein n=1 Tax=Dothidotthia symphoricarpi CBS 119687 TaxID=1392245 RepID=A0A6A6A0T8_9PLEO|nr:uncharacterized protein P153DRAFT_112960 [Dothidotthia symphoricarpi CBS 119687]KAF2125430.1 hypothetical protein P153DRAFT_112960 [Dothidotthia symphoricarpi CBS 119687]
MCLALVVVVLGRGGVGSMASVQADASNLRDVAASASGRCCDSCLAWRACGSPWEMPSGCGGVWRMASSRGGGGGGCRDGVGAKPCPSWLPSSSGDSAPLARLRDCDCGGASALCSDSSHVNGPLDAWAAGERRRRGCAVWTSPSPRVAVVTLAGRRRCVAATAPGACLSPGQTDPLVSTGLYPGSCATQPCRQEWHQRARDCSIKKVRTLECHSLTERADVQHSATTAWR